MLPPSPFLTIGKNAMFPAFVGYNYLFVFIDVKKCITYIDISIMYVNKYVKKMHHLKPNILGKMWVGWHMEHMYYVLFCCLWFHIRSFYNRELQ